MFHDFAYLENNKDSIMGAIRSAGVCLYLLLKFKENEDFIGLFQEELFQYIDLSKLDADSRKKVSLEEIEDNFIVQNLPEILYEIKFDNFRINFIEKLYAKDYTEEAKQFTERLNIAKTLPKETKHSVGGVVNALYNKSYNFLDWIFSKFIDLEHYTTQFAIKDLIFNYLSKIYYYGSDDESAANNVDGDNNLATTDLSNDSDDSSYSDLALLENINNNQECIAPTGSYGGNAHPIFNYYNDFCDVNDSEKLKFLWQDIIDKIDDSDEFEEIVNERVIFIQLLNTGVLVHGEPNCIWQTNPVHGGYKTEEISHIVSFSKKFTNVDFSQQISLALETNEDPVINTFKQQKLLKIKLFENKLKLT